VLADLVVALEMVKTGLQEQVDKVMLAGMETQIPVRLQAAVAVVLALLEETQ
jgi:hypothetical protein